MRPILDIASARVAVELTSKCNLRCGMCPMSDLRRPKVHIPRWLLEKVAADFRDNGIGVKWLHEMGEPLLYPHLSEAIDLFPGCAVSTNAMLLKPKLGERILASTLSRIRLCVDTIDRTVYPAIRRGGKFEQVVDNIRSFLELSRGHAIKVEIQRMITRPTARESVGDFRRFFELDRYPQASVIEKTCEGLDTSNATDLHDSYYGCFQGYPFNWFIVLSDGRVTHCCYDAHGQQSIGDMKTQTVRDILNAASVRNYMKAFKTKDWDTLPRCGECHRNATGKAVVLDHVVRIGHRLDRVFPIKQVARRIINR